MVSNIIFVVEGHINTHIKRVIAVVAQLQHDKKISLTRNNNNMNHLSHCVFIMVLTTDEEKLCSVLCGSKTIVSDGRV